MMTDSITVTRSWISTTLRREMRVTAGRPVQLIGRPHTSAERAAQFASTLLARFLSRPLPWARLSFIFHQAQPGLTLQQFSSQAQVNLTPRLQLTLVRYDAPVPDVAQTLSVAAGKPALTWHLHRPLLPTQAVTRQVRRLESQVRAKMQQQLMEHLVLRSTRLAAVATPGTPPFVHSAAPADLVPRPTSPPDLAKEPTSMVDAVFRTRLPVVLSVAPPVPRVVRRPVVSQTPTVDREARLAAPAEQAQSIGPPAPRWPQQTPTAPDMDISRLTDQVMQQMERRMTAFRERTGRI
jgi:hypothetical protein